MSKKSSKESKFIKFMNNYMINKDDLLSPISHTYMCAPFGKYNIPDDKYDKFLKLYKKMINTDYLLSVVERQKEIGPILVDIDFKQETSERQYTMDMIKTICSYYIKFIKEYLDYKKKEIRLYVLEKDQPTPDAKSTNVFKDGFHIIIPDIPVHYTFRYFIYEKVKEQVILNNIFKKISTINTVDTILDNSVIINNGMLMYGSTKITKIKYELIHIYDYKLNDLKNDDLLNLVNILSFRRYNQNEPIKYKNITQNELNKYEKKNKKSKENKENKENILNEIVYSSNKAPLNSLNEINDDEEMSVETKEKLDFAISLTNILSQERADDYHNWLYVGWTLHNISLKLYNTFINFSKKSKKFDENKCIEIWNKAKNKGYSIASLCYWAKHDNITEYNKLLLKRLNNIIIKAESGTHDDIANMMYEMYKYTYVCTNIKNNNWYEFRNHKWNVIQNGYTLQEKIPSEISKNLTQIATDYLLKSADEKDLSNDLQSKGKKLWDLIRQLKQTPYQKNIMEACRLKFYNNTFVEKLDQNPYLLGFNNGVYDLNNNTFRNGIPDDNITMSVGYDYVEYEETNDMIKEINNYFIQVQQDILKRNYLLRFISSLCDGKQTQTFVFWTGCGANGKSTTQELIKQTLGEYYSTFDPQIITQPRIKAGAASPELADKIGKRCVFIQEPESNDNIYTGQIKQLTGGTDQILARKLYSDPIYFLPQFQLVLTCNKLPNILSNDGGTWRRIKVLEWNSEFISGKIKKSNQFKIDYNLVDKFKDWKAPFIWLLLNKYYKDYKKNGIQEPEAIIEETKKYEKNSDMYREFIDMCIVTDEKNKIEIQSLYDKFTKWFKNENEGSSCPKKKKFVDEMINKKFKIDSNKKYFLNISLKNTDNDSN